MTFTAEFNPKIKTYMMLFVAFFLFITIAGIPILLIWLLGLGQFFGKRYYENLQCELTEKQLQFRKGVLFKVEKTIPLENIQDLTFIQNPLLNVFGMKILKIETAGGSNPHGADMKLIGIVNPEDFKEKVMYQRDLLKQNVSVNTTSTDSNDTLEVLTEIRDLLKEIKDK